MLCIVCIIAVTLIENFNAIITQSIIKNKASAGSYTLNHYR